MRSEPLATQKLIDKTGRVHIPREYRKALGFDKAMEAEADSLVRVELNPDKNELRITRAVHTIKRTAAATKGNE